MRRNIVLAAASLAVLLLLFAVYSLIVVEPYADDDSAAALLSGLPAAEPLDSGGVFQIGEVAMPIPKGGATHFTVFDENTGRPRYSITCANWSKAADSVNEFDVVAPELSFFTPRGERITISADFGRVTGERVEKTNPEWKYGRLHGNARIVIDRSADSLDQTDWPPPEELIIIEMDDVSFDMELGRVSTDGSLTLEGPDFDISGTGLDLTWNDADKRIETLRIARGRELVLKNLAGFLGTSDDESADADGREPVTSAPASASQPAAPPPREARPRAAVSYLCTLSGPVRAERWAGGERVASIDAGGLRLLFDLGGNSGMGQRDRADRSKKQSDGRLVLKWSGELLLTPTEGPSKPIRFRKHEELAPPRRRQRLTALGPLVTLRQYGGRATSVRCGGLEYYEDTGQVWLSGDRDGRVTIDMGGGQRAIASGVYIDQKQGLIKLIGDVQLDMARSTAAAKGNAGRPEASPGTSVYCSQMAELVLRRSTEPGGDAEFGLDLGAMASGLEEARFYGDVCVNLDGEQLFAERLEMRFRSGEKGDSIEALLERLIADGGARLANEQGGIDCGRLVLTFETGDDGRAYPSEFDARGAVSMRREGMSLRGDRVVAKLYAPQATATAGGSSRGRLNVRVLDVIGRAEFVDRVNKVGARGDRIRTWMHDGELEKARVTGSAETLALVHASPYTVRGREIDIAVEQLTLHVDGPSRVSFLAKRGLRGQRRTRRQRVLVAGERSLHIDGHGNRVRVEGDVTVDSGDDHVTASAVTLLLEDVQDTSKSAEQRGGAGRAAWALLAAAAPSAAQTWLLGGQLIARANGAYRDLTRSKNEKSTIARTPRVGRKEPVRMIAENAIVVSETLDPVSGDPLVQMRLAGKGGGPVDLLEVDLNARQMQTTGKTILFVSDYRADARASQATSGGIVPSDLMRGGMSQTVLMCDKSLIYVLGEDGPQRRDSVLLYDRVVMIHRAGRDIVAFDELLADRLDPATLARMKRRHTTLDCDRLECLFGRTTPTGGREGFGSNVPGSRLVWLNASGDVQLIDSPGEVKTEVYADRLTFDRDAGKVSIFGSERIDARVYRTNSATSSFERPFVGPRLTIDLRTNAITAPRLSGEVRP